MKKTVTKNIICILIIAALAVGNYFAMIYENLITVFFSSSDYSITDIEKEKCQEVEAEGAVLLKNEDNALPLKGKGFEYATREGNAIACMASMNRIGSRWAGAHKGLMTHTLRDEWGFKGMAITDQASVPAMFYQDMPSGLWAGTDIWLNTNATFWKLDEYKDNHTVMTHAHNAAKNILYTITNSNAVQSYNDSGMAVDTQGETPIWKIAIYALDIVVVGTCLIVMFTSKKKRFG